jgi:capsular exopolysaccharide synthesis family protein
MFEGEAMSTSPQIAANRASVEPAAHASPSDEEALDLQFLREWQETLRFDSTRWGGFASSAQRQAEGDARFSEAFPPHPLATEARQLRIRLLTLQQEKPFRSLLLTSANKGEGTSTVLSALAAAMARDPHNSILIIDGNLSNPHVHLAFGLHRSPGLADLLTQRLPLRQALQRTALPNLYVLAAGEAISDTSSLLASAEMRARLYQLRQRFDQILIDGPAAASHPEVYLWGKLVDGVVLVLRARQTRTKVVQAVRKGFAGHGCNLLGVVMNRQRYDIPRWLYNRI